MSGVEVGEMALFQVIEFAIRNSFADDVAAMCKTCEYQIGSDA